jgi:hypothetical protein
MKTKKHIRLIKSIKSHKTHIMKKKGKHPFYGLGIYTMCGKHLRTETFTPKIEGLKCKPCFLEPKITWLTKRPNKVK